MKKLIALSVLLVFAMSGILAQTKSKQIKGIIKDESGVVLPHATILLSGTKTGVQSDSLGNFTIRIPDDSKSHTLIISYVGYTAQQVSTGNTDLVIKLQRSAKDLAGDEVVVIGYQSVRRKDLLASVSSIGAKDLKDVPINSAAEALNGRLAGVTATTAEGSPDAQINIRVRGGMSITGDNSPLYIVDGVQVENALSVLSPQNIQSIDVLKDAAATAIYGARGGNGVIIITTKSGKPGKLVVAYNGFIGVKNLSKTLAVLSPYDYVMYQSERSRGNSVDSTNFLTNFGSTWDTLANYKNTNPVNWQDNVLGLTGVTTSHNLSLSGGTKKNVYNFGYTYNDDKAIVMNSSYKRHILNFRDEYQISSKIKLGVGARYTHQDVYGAGISSDQGTAYSRLRNAVQYRPFLSANELIDQNDPLADPNPGNGLGLVNPIKLANAEYRKHSTDAFSANANITYLITKNFTFKSTFGYDRKSIIDRKFSDTITPYSIITGGAKPILELDTTIADTYTNSNVFSYSLKGFKHKHDFDFLVGEESYDLRTTNSVSLFKNIPSFTSPEAAISNTSLGTYFTGYPQLNKTRYTSLSFFSRLNYSYLGKYLFSFNVRSDGASKFAPGKQWGYFPAASFAWRIKNEKFMDNVNFINDLKLRVGIGSVGNNRINDYLYLTTFKNDGSYYYGLNNQAVMAYYSSGLVNSDLKWESTINRNIGLDISLFRSRVDLTVDLYNNSSKDLLLNVPIASTYGYSTQLQNIGKSSNKGVEIQLNSTIIRNKNFSWSANFNISFNKNTIDQLGTNQQYFYPAASWGVSGQPTDYIEKIGSPVGSMYGLVTDGFYKVSDFDYNNGIYTLKSGVVTDNAIIGTVQPGSIKFKDLNGDGSVDLNNDRKIIGNPTPKFTGGISQQFTYKHWDMSLFFNFSYGNDVYNANKIQFTNGYINNSNQLAIMQNHWKVVTPSGATAQWINSSNQVVGISPDQLTALNANANIWMPIKSTGAFYPSSWAIEDGSFLRLNNMSIGYSFPIKKLAGLKMSKLRVYLTGNNLAILTRYSGYDPEVSVSTSPLTPGLDYSAYPKSRSFVFGVNATF